MSGFYGWQTGERVRAMFMIMHTKPVFSLLLFLLCS